MDDVRYPGIAVPLVGVNGNAFVIIGTVLRHLGMAGVSEEEKEEFKKEAMSGDYDHLLQTCMKWVTVE